MGIPELVAVGVGHRRPIVSVELAVLVPRLGPVGVDDRRAIVSVELAVLVPRQHIIIIIDQDSVGEVLFWLWRELDHVMFLSLSAKIVLPAASRRAVIT
jgi:hypothetical protein